MTTRSEWDGLSGAQALATSPALVERLRALRLHASLRARQSIFDFYDFVMRKPDGNDRVRLADAPHHRLMLEFLMAEQHKECVILAPVGSGKSHVTCCYLLWRIGHNATERGCIVSATELQASKVLNLVRQYIDTSDELRMVFPDLTRGRRDGDKWTETAITVHRPAGIKDPTLQAFGVETEAVQGSRLNFVLGDDILNDENTSTPERRARVRAKFEGSFVSRLTRQDPTRKCVLVNTPWHPEDAVEMAAMPPSPDGSGGMGWACIRMDAYGDITVTDDARVELGHPGYETWDSDLLRPTIPNTDDPRCRLVAHDPDPDNVVTLWPEVKWPTAADIDRERVGKLPVIFNQTLRCIVRDDASAMCPAAYVRRCYAVAKALGVKSFAADLDSAKGGPFIQVFTGVDPAFTEHDKSDFSAVFTFGVRADGIKVVLDVTYGKWPPPVFAQVVAGIVSRFNPVVAIEDNAGGGVLISFMRANNMGFPIKPMRTGKEKWSPEHGVATFFAEMEDGSWAFPHLPPDAMHKMAEDCINYVPVKHTPDTLMAAFVARKLAKKWGVLHGQGAEAERRQKATAHRFAKEREALALQQARTGSRATAVGGIALAVMSR